MVCDRLSAVSVVYRSFNGNTGRLTAVSIFYRTFIGHTGHLTDIYPTKFTLFICAINVHFVQLLCNGAFSFKILPFQFLDILFNFFQALLLFYRLLSYLVFLIFLIRFFQRSVVADFSGMGE